ncbi:hypothetical protein SKAU_G00222600 [Synaphobranchus kaupii]|uniref:Uncharacterized protein n=1 Tax=Synaphobranchus kaupii TaxID=118154 RepID=A0A9Q1IW70_SYNKA|nr:hypothetical protein SKAU_G00222600 [Synaphobranchus kaupii]
MAATQGRRKHGTCFLRIKEHCPFRKLRKNKCYDIENVPAKKTGERWARFSDHPTLAVPQADSGISVVCLEPHAQVAFPQPACCFDQSQEQPMDTDNVRPRASQAEASNAPGASSSPAPSPPVPLPQNLQNPSPFNCDTSMELDSGVDPETGERAQG